jgi:hypothetical protein
VNRTTFNDSGGAKSDKTGSRGPLVDQPGLAELGGIPVGAGQKAPEKRQSGGQIRTKDRGEAPARLAGNPFHGNRAGHPATCSNVRLRMTCGIVRLALAGDPFAHLG